MKKSLQQLQKDVYQNKIDKGFNTTDIAQEFCRAHEELSEAFKKQHHGEDGVGEELADVAIFLLGMCEMLGYDLESELIRKVEINKNRVYKKHVNEDGKEVLIRVKTDIDP